MLFTEFAIGTELSIHIANDDNSMVFESTISYILDDYTILVPPITYNNKTLKLNGKELQRECYVISETLPIFFEDITISLVRYKGELYNRIVATKTGVKTNRRNSFRVYIGIDGRLTVERTLEEVNVIVKDVSTTGFAFVCRDDLDILHQNVRLYFIDEGQRITLRGSVIRKIETQGRYLYGCTLEVTPLALGKYINEVQMRKKRQQQ